MWADPIEGERPRLEAGIARDGVKENGSQGGKESKSLFFREKGEKNCEV